MSLVVAVLGVGTLVVFAIVVLVFVVIGVAVAPRSDPRSPGRHEPLTLDELEDDSSE